MLGFSLTLSFFWLLSYNIHQINSYIFGVDGGKKLEQWRTVKWTDLQICKVFTFFFRFSLFFPKLETVEEAESMQATFSPVNRLH